MALPVLAVCAGAIGNARRVRLKPTWTEPSVLWALPVGYSGDLKSPALEAATAPIQALQSAAARDHKGPAEEYRKARLRYERDLAAWKRKAKAVGDPPEEPRAPTMRRALVADTTIEALAVVLDQNPRGVLVRRDEWTGWIRSFDQYRGGKGGDVAAWLEFHRAGPLLVDRKSNGGMPLFVPRAAVSITGGVQPDILVGALAEEHFADGLAARLLLAWPPRRPKSWKECPKSPAADNYGALVRDLAALPMGIGPDGAPAPEDLPLGPDGREVWIEFYNDFAERQARAEGRMAAALSKLEGAAARLALVLHLVRLVAGDRTAPEGQIDAVSVAMGAELARWFANETERIYRIFAAGPARREEERLLAWIRAQDGPPTARDLARSNDKYGSTEAARAVLEALAVKGLGRWQPKPPGPTGGRPTEAFVITEPQGADTTETDETPLSRKPS